MWNLSFLILEIFFDYKKIAQKFSIERNLSLPDGVFLPIFFSIGYLNFIVDTMAFFGNSWCKGVGLEDLDLGLHILVQIMSITSQFFLINFQKSTVIGVIFQPFMAPN